LFDFSTKNSTSNFAKITFSALVRTLSPQKSAFLIANVVFNNEKRVFGVKHTVSKGKSPFRQ